MSAAPYVVLSVSIIAGLIFSDVYCRDATNIHQSNTQIKNWPEIPSWDSNVKSSTTPWPALGRRPLNSSVFHANAPIWVTPTAPRRFPWQSQNVTTFNVNSRGNNWQRPNSNIPNRNINAGPLTNGNNQENGENENDEVTDAELRQFSEELLEKDVNNAAKYVTVNLQSKTTSRSTTDEAPMPLLSIDAKAYEIPSISKLVLLHDNYVVESNVYEDNTPQEQQEENSLLDLVLGTPVMQHTRNFLIQKGKIGQDPKDFKNLLHDIWFEMYPRGGGRVGSSGFEHVFLAEIKKGQVSGLHNWLYFNEQEKHNRANYLGYMKKVDLGNKGAILKYHFTFHDVDKPVGSMFIGTSPEFEMALYSTCFVLRADKTCPMKLNGNKFIIRTFTYRYHRKKLIGSAFPDV